MATKCKTCGRKVYESEDDVPANARTAGMYVLLAYFDEDSEQCHQCQDDPDTPDAA